MLDIHEYCLLKNQNKPSSDALQSCAPKKIRWLPRSPRFRFTPWRAVMEEDKNGKSKPLYLRQARQTHIRRHVKIRVETNPFDPRYKEYFEQRDKRTRYRKASVGQQSHFCRVENYSAL